MVLELQRAQRVRDPLDGIRLAVREVIGRIDAPRIAGAGMRGMQDAVQHRIAQVHVRRGHVDLRAQHARAVGEFAGPHAPQQVEVLLDGPVAIGAVLAGLGQRAPLGAHFGGRRVVHVRLAFPDQMLGPRVQLLEVIRCVVEMFAPVEAQPVHVALDRVDELLLFLRRIGVVEAQMATAAELLCDPEVQADGLGVADMQIAVRLRRESGDHLGHASGLDVALDHLTNEVAPGIARGCRFACRFGCRHMTRS